MSAVESILTTNIDDRIEKLHRMQMGNHEFLVNTALGYYPYFSVELRNRVKKQKAVNAVVTGEGGVSKSYTTMDICRVLSPKHFTPDDIVFRYPEFLRAILTTKRGTPIEYDEPSYSMSKKDWFKEVVKALVKTIESFRYKGKPLFIPIINKKLLEKDIRSYLLQYHVVMQDRGKGTVYKIFPSQFKDKVYSYEVCKLRYGLFDNNLCDRSCLKPQKNSNYCLSLLPDKKKERCMIFRAQYERRKISTQEDRYEVALEDAEKQETSNLTLDEIQAKALLYFDKYYMPDKNKINVEDLFIVLKREEKIILGHSRAYRLARQIKYDHPELFETPPAVHKDNADKVT
jgi:hypothetical protein